MDPKTTSPRSPCWWPSPTTAPRCAAGTPGGSGRVLDRPALRTSLDADPSGVAWPAPGRINNLAIQALVAAYAAKKAIVDESSARAAITEITGPVVFGSLQRVA